LTIVPSPRPQVGTDGVGPKSALVHLHPWLSDVMHRALKQTGCITAHLSVFDDAGNRVSTAAVGEHAEVYSRIGGPSRQGVTNLALNSRHSHIIPDVQKTDEWKLAMREAEDCRDDEYRKLLNSFRSEIALPLFGSEPNGRRGRVIAVLNVHHAQKDGLNQRSLNRLRRLCKGAARAIENAIPYDTAVESAGWQKKMQEAIRHIHEQSDDVSAKRPSLYQLIVEEGAMLARAEVVGIWMEHEFTQEFHLAAVTTCCSASYKQCRAPRAQGIRGKVFQTGKAYYCPDTSKDESWYACIPRIRSCYVIPVYRNRKVVGVLCFDSDGVSTSLR
jgi:GAF domain-containing protein